MSRLGSLLGMGLALAAFSDGAFAAQECNGPLTGTIRGGVVVNDGDNCMLGGANVAGGVQVRAGGILVACGSTINGGLNSNGAAEVIVGAEEIGCDGTVINGGVRISGTGVGIFPPPTPSIAVERSAIQGGVFLTGNAGITSISNNTIAGGLFCKNNAMNPEDEGTPSKITGAVTCEFEESPDGDAPVTNR
jgi:hypothetical protein